MSRLPLVAAALFAALAALDPAQAAQGAGVPYAGSPSARPCAPGADRLGPTGAATSEAATGGAGLAVPIGGGITVGERYPAAHVVTKPGRYGLGEAPEGEAYAVIGRSLVRIDHASCKVLGILRPVEGPRD